MPVKQKPNPEAAAAAILFADVPRATTGSGCIACTNTALREQIDHVLLGMLGEGPYAGSVPIYITITEVWRRLHDPDRAKRAGTIPYPRQESAFRAHVSDHRADIWRRVKAAKQASGY